MAARADRGRTLSRPHRHLDTLLVRTEPGVLVDKSLEAVAAVENRDQFHGARASGGKNHYHNGPRPKSPCGIRCFRRALGSPAVLAARRDSIRDLDEIASVW